MSTNPDPASAPTFMVVATLRDDTDLAEFAALRDDEHKQARGREPGSDDAVARAAGADHHQQARATSPRW
jgi:hypothetical protein